MRRLSDDSSRQPPAAVDAEFTVVRPTPVRGWLNAIAKTTLAVVGLIIAMVVVFEYTSNTNHRTAMMIMPAQAQSSAPPPAPAQTQQPVATSTPPAQQRCVGADCYRYRVFAAEVISPQLQLEVTRQNSRERAIPARGNSNSRSFHQDIPGWVSAGVARYVTDCKVRAGLYREIPGPGGRTLPGELVTDLGDLSPITNRETGQVYFETWVNKDTRRGQMLVLESQDNCLQAGEGNRLYFYSAERRQVRAEGGFLHRRSFCTRIAIPRQAVEWQCGETRLPDSTPASQRPARRSPPNPRATAT